MLMSKLNETSRSRLKNISLRHFPMPLNQNFPPAMSCSMILVGVLNNVLWFFGSQSKPCAMRMLNRSSVALFEIRFLLHQSRKFSSNDDEEIWTVEFETFELLFGGTFSLKNNCFIFLLRRCILTRSLTEIGRLWTLGFRPMIDRKKLLTLILKLNQCCLISMTYNRTEDEDELKSTESRLRMRCLLAH